MKHCTIVFKECERGHGWLTATNWVQHGCWVCERDHLREKLKEQQSCDQCGRSLFCGTCEGRGLDE